VLDSDYNDGISGKNRATAGGVRPDRQISAFVTLLRVK
jgi:hypothetical protein